MNKALSLEAKLNTIANPAESREIGLLDSDKGPSCQEINSARVRMKTDDAFLYIEKTVESYIFYKDN
jgi:hypothetical protein